jgi:hypothetical protein
MDISQFEVRIPSLSDLNTHISESIKIEVRKQMESLLHRIAQGESIPVEYLKEHYMQVSDIDSSSVVHKQPKKKICSSDQCKAKVSTGAQCSRRSKQPDMYCGGHLNSRPYGEVDVVDETEPLEAPES